MIMIMNLEIHIQHLVITERSPISFQNSYYTCISIYTCYSTTSKIIFKNYLMNRDSYLYNKEKDLLTPIIFKGPTSSLY